MIVVFSFVADIFRYGEGIASAGDEPDARTDQSAATRTEKPSLSASTDAPTVTLSLIDMIRLVSMLGL